MIAISAIRLPAPPCREVSLPWSDRTRSLRCAQLSHPADFRAGGSPFEQLIGGQGRTGALDLPGQTWRDRPAIDRGDAVYVVGDMVAAPGMRGEISINSALPAAS
ncbi:hypothetical protein ACFZC5_26310 [Nocardia gamkensis]|uniref:hypothetical protein n=1 Tax=Nocardia gamkensis TaxID=352869 RepID=UPI0036F086F1